MFQYVSMCFNMFQYVSICFNMFQYVSICFNDCKRFNQGVLYPGRHEPVALLVATLLPATGEAPESAGRHLRRAGRGAGHGAGYTVTSVTWDGHEIFWGHTYPLVNYRNYGKSPFLMGKSTINGHFQ